MSKNTGQRLSQSLAFLSGANRAYLEDLFARFNENPDSVPDEWSGFFADLPIEPAFSSGAPIAETVTAEENDSGRKQAAVLRLINAYRMRGHSIANTDPLGIANPIIPEDFDLSFQGLSDDDLLRTFDTGSLAFGPDRLPLERISDLCNDVYCGPVGVEFMHISDTAEKRWLQNHLETDPVRPRPSADFKKHLLQRLTAAEGLERYLHTRFGFRKSRG